jgi:glycosyltransferase involved in cell wall biosynthesis
MTMPAEGFPKILFINDHRPDAQTLGDLVRQLLLGYPVEKLHWWHCRETSRYEKPDLHAASVQGCCIPNKLVPHRRLAGVKSFILENFWAQRAARHLERTIAEVKPDLIWVLLGGWTIPVIERTHIPAGVRISGLVCDFPDTKSLEAAMGVARCQRFVKTVIRMVQRSESYSGGGHEMVAELNVRTGRANGLVVHSGFELNHLQALENVPKDVSQDDLVRLAYVGTIISEKGFLDLLGALKRVRATLPKKVILEFFGGRNYRNRAWFDPSWMNEHGMFTDEGLVRALRLFDWGITVMDPEAADLQYSRFSFPNKVGTYLSAGVPVLGYGNPKSSLIEIMQSYRLGCYSCTTDTVALENFLRECLQIANPRVQYHDDIIQCARTEFNAADMRARLWRLWGVK